MGAYVATKWALIGLTQQLALEYAPAVRVNCVCPGTVDTEEMDKTFARRDALAGTAPGRAKEKRIAALPLKRQGRPEDIGNAVVFLASDAADWVTGQSDERRRRPGDELTPRPYRIDVPDAVLADLRRRLGADPLAGADPRLGLGLRADVEASATSATTGATATTGARTRRSSTSIPGFLCEVDGVDLHFWHVRCAAPDPLPLLLLHGWPGSIYEFHQVLGPLTRARSTSSSPRCRASGSAASRASAAGASRGSPPRSTR